MSLWKKTKDLFSRLAGSETPPPARRPATVDVSGDKPVSDAQIILDPRFKYRAEQRAFERRAKLRTVFWDSARFGTYRRGMGVE